VRDNFTVSVIDTLGRRAGQLCSNPQCRQPTSGPAQQPEKSINVGVASHITAASAGGPRYDPELTTEARSSIENGIWLCQTCAKLIDSDVGRFTVAVLVSWKSTAEALALEQLESGRRSSTPAINAAVVIQGENAIHISGTNAVNIAPGGITIVGPIVHE
jgi:hypothetical protein